MQASIVDLRYHMKEVLAALRRNEAITVLYHGKKIATLSPVHPAKEGLIVQKHPFFGMLKDQTSSVATQLRKLRGARYRDI